MDDRSLKKSYFNHRQALVFRLVSSFLVKLMKLARVVGFVFLILSILLSLTGALSEILSWPYVNIFLGGAFIAFGLFWISWLMYLFYKLQIINSRPRLELREALERGRNLADYFSFDLARIFSDAFRGPKLITRPIILARFLIICDPSLDFILMRLGLSRSVLEKRLKIEIDRTVWSDEAISWEDIVVAAAERAAKRESNWIESGDLLHALFHFIPFFNEIMIEQEMALEDVNNVVEWYERIKAEADKFKKFWDYENLVRKGGLARHWAAAYTLTIDEYSRDITEIARERGGRPSVFGHESELEQVENILAGSGRNNVLLVGQIGSGRIEVVISLAAKSFWGTSLPALNGKRVMELDLLTITARAPSIEEMESILDKCFQEAIAMSNVILVIRNLEDFVKTTKVGAPDISNLLVKYLESPRFQVIAIASYAGLHRDIEKLPAILNLFNKVEVAPPSAHETIIILEYMVPEFESRYNRFIPYLTLKRVVERSARYLQDKPFPRKAIDLLDEVMVYASRQPGTSYVDPSWVDLVISRRAEIPIGRIQSSEKEMLLKLEHLIHERVVNQDEAVKEVSSALRRARAEVTTRRTQPMGSFLFLGPTGVGKTETAKALTAIYFGSEEKIIRIDMSEFQDSSDIYRLIGNRDHVGLLSSQVRENPFSLVLLDEIEKAHPDILNLFLTVFDEGYLTDGFGQKVIFSDTIIVATSNAGAEIIRRDIEANMSLGLLKNELLEHLMREKYFRPELINRFTAVVVFKVLNPKHLLEVADLMLGRLNKALDEKGIAFEWDQVLKERIVELGYKPAFGAREMERVVHDQVGNALAQAILRDEIKRGDRVKVNAADFSVKLIRDEF